MAHMCLYSCLTMLGHAPNQMTNGVLGDCLTDMDWEITFVQSAVQPGGVLLDLGQASVSPWYQFLHPPRTNHILFSHEAGHWPGPA